MDDKDGNDSDNDDKYNIYIYLPNNCNEIKPNATAATSRKAKVVNKLRIIFASIIVNR